MRAASIGIIVGLFAVIFISSLLILVTSLVGTQEVKAGEQMKMISLQSQHDSSTLVNLMQSYPEIGGQDFPAHYLLLSGQNCMEDRADLGIVSDMNDCLEAGGDFDSCEAANVGECEFAEELFGMVYDLDSRYVRIVCLDADCVEIRVGMVSRKNKIDDIVLYSSEIGRVEVELYG